MTRLLSALLLACLIANTAQAQKPRRAKPAPKPDPSSLTIDCAKTPTACSTIGAFDTDLSNLVYTLPPQDLAFVGQYEGSVCRGNTGVFRCVDAERVNRFLVTLPRCDTPPQRGIQVVTSARIFFGSEGEFTVSFFGSDESLLTQFPLIWYGAACAPMRALLDLIASDGSDR